MLFQIMGKLTEEETSQDVVIDIKKENSWNIPVGRDEDRM
jgi:hypothetical protein